MRRITKAAMAGVAAVGIAVAAASTAVAHDGGRGMGPGQGGRPVVSESVVQQADGSYVTVRMVRGEITAVSSTSITVKAPNGTSSTFAVNADTTVRKDGATAAMSGLAVGDTVHVAGTVSGGTATATMIGTGEPRGGKGGFGHRGGRHGKPASSSSASPSA